MGVQDSFSRLKKKVKRLGNKRKPDRTGLDTGGESVDSGSLLPQPEPPLVGDDGEGDGTDTDGGQARSTDRPPRPDEPRPSGHEDDEGGEASEVTQKDLHPYPDIEVVVESGPSHEGNHANTENIYPHSSTPPILHSEKPDGTRTWLFQLLLLTIPPGSADTPAIPDHITEASCSNKSVELGPVIEGDTLDRRSTISPTTKLLHGVRDSVNAFAPLKSVAGHLFFILEICKVCLYI